MHKQAYKQLHMPLNIAPYSRFLLSTFNAGISHHSANDIAESIQFPLSLTTSRRRLIPTTLLRRRIPVILRRRTILPPVSLRRRLPIILRRRLPIVLRRRLPIILRRRLPIILRRRLPVTLRRRTPATLRRRTPTTSRRRSSSSGATKSTDNRTIKIEIPIGAAVGGVSFVGGIVLFAYLAIKGYLKKICGRRE